MSSKIFKLPYSTAFIIYLQYLGYFVCLQFVSLQLQGFERQRLVRETRGVGKVANDRYWSATVMIDILSLFILPPSWNNSFSFSAHSSPMTSPMTNGGTGTVPPMYQWYSACPTISHGYAKSQILFVFAAPVYWWDWLAAPVLTVRYKGGLSCQQHQT